MENGVTNRQLFFIGIITTIGFSAAELPKIMGETAGTGAWFTLLLATVFFSFAVFVIVYLGNEYKGKTLFDYSKLLVGKPLSYCFSAIYMIYFFVLLTLIVRSSADIIKSEILFKTPIWASMLLIIAISGYAASKGLTNLGRIIEYLGFILLAIGFILHIITLTQGNMLDIMPLFDTSEAMKYIDALPSTIFMFLGFEVITVIPFTKSNGVKSVLSAMASIFVLGIFYILIVESCYSVLGVDDVVNYDYPLVVAIRELDISILQFAKRLDLFFFIAWLTAIFCSVSMVAFTVTEYTKKLIPKFKGNLVLVILCALALLAGLLFPNTEVVSTFFVWFETYLGLIPAFIIPFFLFVVHLCKS